MRKDYLPVSVHDALADESRFVEEFWSRRWEGMAQLPKSEAVARSPEYKIMRPFLQTLAAGSRILDGGCGMGAWVVFLSNRGFDVVGLDISDTAVNRLKEILPSYRFVRGDIRHTGFPDAWFDVYFSWGTFEHFELGLGECVSEAHRILKSGGLLFVSVPYQNWRHLLRDSRALHKWDPTYDAQYGYRQPQRFYQWRFTRPELQRELELRGFRVRQIRAIHKASGVYRWLQWDFRLFKEGTKLFGLAQRVFTILLPSHYVSHMIMAVAQKTEIK